MKKEIKKGFIIHWNKNINTDKVCFFVRSKELNFPSTPVEPIDLPRFLIDKIKGVKERKRK